MVYIERNGNRFGPYSDDTLRGYVDAGQILLCDRAIDAATGETVTVRAYLKARGIKVRIRNAGDFVTQLRNIGSDLIFPKSSFRSQWAQDSRLVLLALVGLTPSVLMFLPVDGVLVFYFIAMYFSLIWGLFFYYLFKTPQVTTRTTVAIFFAVQAFVFLVWDLLWLAHMNPFYILLNLSFPLDALGYIFGVGLTEAFAKALPLLILARKARQPLLPQTLVYYGLMSGIGFGVFEGVEYQTTVNIDLDYTSAFFMNIARLTSLPFLHAIWCGIAGYFIAFAKLYPKYRISLYVLAIAIPAVLHGIYDTFCGSTLGLLVAVPVMAVSVLLLITYLNRSVNYQSRLRQ